MHAGNELGVEALGVLDGLANPDPFILDYQLKVKPTVGYQSDH